MAPIIIFGPNGIGKSTVANKLSKQFNVVDLEDTDINLATRQKIANADFVNAGALNPNSSVISDCPKILLYLPYQEYIERRNARNSKYPHKKNQMEDSPDRWVKLSKWSKIFAADDNIITKLIEFKRSIDN